MHLFQQYVIDEIIHNTNLYALSKKRKICLWKNKNWKHVFGMNGHLISQIAKVKNVLVIKKRALSWFDSKCLASWYISKGFEGFPLLIIMHRYQETLISCSKSGQREMHFRNYSSEQLVLKNFNMVISKSFFSKDSYLKPCTPLQKKPKSRGVWQ